MYVPYYPSGPGMDYTLVIDPTGMCNVYIPCYSSGPRKEFPLVIIPTGMSMYHTLLQVLVWTVLLLSWVCIILYFRSRYWLSSCYNSYRYMYVTYYPSGPGMFCPLVIDPTDMCIYPNILQVLVRSFLVIDPIGMCKYPTILQVLVRSFLLL